MSLEFYEDKPEPKKEWEPIPEEINSSNEPGWNPGGYSEPPIHEYRTPQYRPVPSRNIPWNTIILWLIIVGLSAFIIWDKLPKDNLPDGIDPPPGPEGSAVVLMYQDKDIPSYAKEARNALNSSKIPQAVGDTIFYKLDVDDDVSALEPVVKSIANQHTPKLPWLFILNNKKLISEELKSEEQALTRIKEQLK